MRSPERDFEDSTEDSTQAHVEHRPHEPHRMVEPNPRWRLPRNGRCRTRRCDVLRTKAYQDARKTPERSQISPNPGSACLFPPPAQTCVALRNARLRRRHPSRRFLRLSRLSQAGGHQFFDAGTPPWFIKPFRARQCPVTGYGLPVRQIWSGSGEPSAERSKGNGADSPRGLRPLARVTQLLIDHRHSSPSPTKAKALRACPRSPR